MTDELLLERFVASFEKLDELTAWDSDPIAKQLAIGNPDHLGFRHWRPIPASSPASLLDPLYAKLPARLPKLYERLVLSYRWAEVHLETFTLLANPPGPDLSGLLNRCRAIQHCGTLCCQLGTSNLEKGPTWTTIQSVSTSNPGRKMETAGSLRSITKKFFATIALNLSQN